MLVIAELIVIFFVQEIKKNNSWTLSEIVDICFVYVVGVAPEVDLQNRTLLRKCRTWPEVPRVSRKRHRTIIRSTGNASQQEVSRSDIRAAASEPTPNTLIA